MRHMRLRLRSSILVILAMLTILFLITLHTFIWSTHELERLERIPDGPIRPGPVPFWSAIDHQNIYDLYATPASTILKRSSTITQQRIEDLFQLVRNARADEIHLSDVKQLFPVEPEWDFQRLVDEHRPSPSSDDDNQQKVETHDETANGTNNEAKTTTVTDPTTTTTEKIVNEHDSVQLRNYVIHRLTKWRTRHRNDKVITLAEIMYEDIAKDEPSRLNTSWYAYMKTATNLRVYDPHSPELKFLLNHLKNAQITEANEMSQGTQIKIVFDFPETFEGLFKPYRVPRNYQTLPDHFYFTDVERHHAEIAAFHLDKVLGFYRVPPVVGRIVNITRDIREKATEDLASTFFISPANNTCFRGHCSYYCDTSHAVCGKPGDRLEGSVQVLLPRPPDIEWDKITHPYRRSYSAVRKAKWELNEQYCYSHVLLESDFHNRLLLDMMDLAAFDFLIGNQDRHHMMRIYSFGSNSALIHLDNGRSFGRHDFDDLTILTPIRQCCFFRYSTFARLYRVYRQGLSTLLARSLESGETLQQILIAEHLQALDRRLEVIFEHIETCIKTYTVKGVMIDDGID